MNKGIFDGVVIATDLDDTFLGKNSRIVPENLEAIEYFKANGGRFTFCTGRVYKHFLRGVPIAPALTNAPIICCNGSYMYDAQSNKTAFTNAGNTDLYREAVKLARDTHPEVGARVCTSYGYISDGRTELIKKDLAEFTDEESRILPVEDWYVLPGEEWFKIVFRGEPQPLTEARAVVEERFGDAFEYANSGPVFFEINMKGCNKAFGVKKLKAMIGADILVCCGDYENDMSMLRAADFAVCPSNAMDGVKEICDLTLCDCDKGIFGELIPIVEERMMRDNSAGNRNRILRRYNS